MKKFPRTVQRPPGAKTTVAVVHLLQQYVCENWEALDDKDEALGFCMGIVMVASRAATAVNLDLRTIVSAVEEADEELSMTQQQAAQSLRKGKEHEHN